MKINLGKLIGAGSGLGAAYTLTIAMDVVAPGSGMLARIGMGIGTLATSAIIGEAINEIVTEKLDDFKARVEQKKQEIMEARDIKPYKKEEKKEPKKENKKLKRVK